MAVYLHPIVVLAVEEHRKVFFIAVGGLCLGLGIFGLWVIAERMLLPDADPAVLVHLHTVRGIVGTFSATCFTLWFVLRARRRTEERLLKANRELKEANRNAFELLSMTEELESFSVRYENPNLVRCYEIRNCTETDCPLRKSDNPRCWQVVGTHCCGKDGDSLISKLRDCRKCIVYQRACFNPLAEMGENFNNMMAVLEDKSEEIKQIREQVLRAEKMAIVGEIAAGLAHEINNPLGGIRNCLHRIVKNPENQKQIIEYSEMMAEALDRIEKVLRRLLDFSREYQYRFDKVDLNLMLEQSLALFQYTLLSRNIEIDKQCQQPLPQAEVDYDAMIQVTLNLMLNAASAMPEGGKLSIKTFEEKGFGKDNGRVCVSISDTGSGISDSIAEKIFEPFFTTKPAGEGTGLGLPISMKIVKEHDGDLSFTSVPEQGTTFTIKLPLRHTMVPIDQSPAVYRFSNPSSSSKALKKPVTAKTAGSAK